MVAKQKVAFIVAIVVFFSAIATTVFTPSQAFADYTVDSIDQKCDDGKSPTPQVNAGKTVYNCTGERSTPQETNPGTGTQESDKDGAEDDTVTCAIEKMGWILCPVIETAGKVGDKAFALLANNFLQTEPELVSQGSGTKTAWGLALNLANLMFIAVFIIIILSQVTGRGINNYGIKKLLPRLIIGAILVNVSYYVCQLMVDLSNILGFELKNFLVDTARSVSSSSVFPQQTSIDNQTSNGTLGLIATGILATAAIVWFLLPVLFLGVSTVVITCLVVIAILLLRKALIILLVVLSPIAFVAYLLPNTEGYFQKWLKMFWQLLMVFPIVGMLFGAGQLASAIILVAGTNSSQVQSTNSTATTTKTDSSYDDPGTKKGGKCIQLPKGSVEGRLGKCTGGSTPFMLGLVAAGVAVAPLLAVWAVLKGALSAAGAIGGKIAGAVQSAGNKGNQLGKAGEDKLKKRMGENLNRRWQNRQARAVESGTGLTARYAKRKFDRQRDLNLSKAGLESQLQQSFGTEMASTAGLSAAGKQIGQSIMEEAEMKEVNAAMVGVKKLKGEDLEALAVHGAGGGMSGEAAQKAAIQKMAENQDIAGLERVAVTAASHDMGQALAQAIDKNYSSIKQKGAHLVDGTFTDTLRSGGAVTETSLDKAMDRAMGGMTPELLATQTGASLNRVSNALNSPDSTNSTEIREIAKQLANNTQVMAKVDANRATFINNIKAR